MKQRKAKKNDVNGNKPLSPAFNGTLGENMKRIPINEDFRKANQKLMADIKKTLHSSLDDAYGSPGGAIPERASIEKNRRQFRRGKPGENR